METYPRDKLLIVEDISTPSLASRRLEDVRYEALRLPGVRLRNTRFSTLYASFACLASALLNARIDRAVRGFMPEAVLTVAHGFMWIAAAKYACANTIPLHLLVHDDWKNVTAAKLLPRNFRDRIFGSIYRRASSRFCVSEFMRDEYFRRYQARGIVLFPLRALEEPSADAGIVIECRSNDGPPVVAFAGTINSIGYARLIRSLAEELMKRNGTLLLYGPHTVESLEKWGLVAGNIRSEGLVDARELVGTLRRTVDALFVPMSFDGGDEKENMKMGFPSKLADYTATGLPLVICGPSYCSAVRWAIKNGPLAEVVTSENPLDLGAALDRLKEPGHRKKLADRAREVGEAHFAPSVARSTVYTALNKFCVS